MKEWAKKLMSDKPLTEAEMLELITDCSIEVTILKPGDKEYEEYEALVERQDSTIH